MYLVVPIIVVGIIALQIYFFIKNTTRMKEFKQIFDEEDTWSIVHDEETTFVSGIDGEGNYIFESIKESINKYLGGNSGSVIDFNLLKDAVDRHCDSVENDINTLTPVPLYCGLVGTMVGVIMGLLSLLATGSITSLLSSGAGNFGTAAEGVNDLLSGVAWAMIASICGICLTTSSSILFKKYKQEGESGKNTFLAWLQAKLLPELPSDTSDALNKLVKNLNKFNSTFSQNTTELRDALSGVNESYHTQAEIINAVHDMDVMKMAQANVKVLKELKGCTDKLEQFNEYLNDIHGYTDAIHTFTTQFESEADRLHVLEEIQQYFMRHKAEIAKDSADVDVALREAMDTINESATSSAGELSKTLIEQSEEFKRIIREEKDSFEQLSSEIKSQFSVQLSEMPMLEKKLGEISAIPEKLDRLISRIEDSNNTLASRVSSTMENTARNIAAKNIGGPMNGESNKQKVVMFPSWMRWAILISVIVIAITCVANSVNNIFFSNNSRSDVTPDSNMIENFDTQVVDTIVVDSVH